MTISPVHNCNPDGRNKRGGQLSQHPETPSTNINTSSPIHHGFQRDRSPLHHRPMSPFPIFKVSEECVGQIMSYLGGSDLAALALVDKDCRQLARTRQFSSVLINFSTGSMAILNTLVSEARVRAGNPAGPHRWRLGACIRQMSIAVENCSDGLARSTEYERGGSRISSQPHERTGAHTSACGSES